MKNFLHLDGDLYQQVIDRLLKENKRSHASVLIKLRERGTLQFPEAVIINERKEGELSAAQKEAITILHSGGKLLSLRWQEHVYCCTYYQSKGKNIDTGEVEELLKKGLIVGIPQNLFPDKEYVLTDMGKAVKI